MDIGRALESGTLLGRSVEHSAVLNAPYSLVINKLRDQTCGYAWNIWLWRRVADINGNTFPLRIPRGTLQRMNRKLSDQQIRSTFQRLSNGSQSVSGRALRAALRAQFGAAGRTDRVFAICRSLRTPDVRASAEVLELRQRIEAAEQGRALAERARDQALARAERSEARELAHQDRWANEIYELRQRVEQLKGEGARRLALQEQVVRLAREVQGLRQQLERRGGGEP